MKITVKKSDNVDVILQTSYIDPLSTSEMRDTLTLALEQEGYDKYYIDEVFNTRKFEPLVCEPESDGRDYFSKELEKQCPDLCDVKNTTEFQDKADKIVDLINSTTGPIKVLWVLRDMQEMQEAIEALGQDSLKGFSAVYLGDRYLISRAFSPNHSPSERDVCIVLSIHKLPGFFTLTIV